MDVLDLLTRGTAWAQSKVEGVDPAQHVDPTPCAEWEVRLLLNHMIGGCLMYAEIGRGEFIGTDGWHGDYVGTDPAASYASARAELLETYGTPATLEKIVVGTIGQASAGEMAGLFFTDQLVHGWDLATATGRDATMPRDLADAAWSILGGRIPDVIRDPQGSVFKPAAAVGVDADAQSRLLAYTGRERRAP